MPIILPPVFGDRGRVQSLFDEAISAPHGGFVHVPAELYGTPAIDIAQIINGIIDEHEHRRTCITYQDIARDRARQKKGNGS